MKVRELELKWRLPDSFSAEGFVSTANALGTVAAQHDQRDYVFARNMADLLNPREGVVVARVRVSGEQCLLTVKQRRKSNLDRTEVEVLVGDEQSARQILLLLDLEEQVVISKRRHELTIEPRVTLNIDVVDNLGIYCELEWILDASEVDGEASVLLGKLEGEHQELFSALALDEARRVTDGYDTLLLRKLN